MNPEVFADAMENNKARSLEILNRTEPRIEFGDLYMLDREDLGIDFFSGVTKNKIMFLNQGGELKLLDHLLKKYPQGRASENVLAGLRSPAPN
jgi:hypothetical protein